MYGRAAISNTVIGEEKTCKEMYFQQPRKLIENTCHRGRFWARPLARV